jgi:hypothetical protein
VSPHRCREAEGVSKSIYTGNIYASKPIEGLAGTITTRANTKETAVRKCLYLTEIKPSRKSAQQLVDWLKDNYPDCSFTEINAAKKSYPAQNGGRYQGRVDGPEHWGDEAHAADRLALREGTKRLLTGMP